jgi:predicted DNA-binding protein (UPF0251 family)
MMPRPIKYRRICKLPEVTSFAPTNNYNKSNRKVIVMNVDEYEAIRLIDYEGMTQEECAFQMEIARTTAQKIYNDARKKLALMIIDGGRLIIKGGSFIVCQESRQGMRCSRCRKTDIKQEEES